MAYRIRFSELNVRDTGKLDYGRPCGTLIRDIDPTTSSDQVRDALSRVLESEQFARSESLRALLTDVVDEAIAGRGDTIRGKTIAQDVYNRDPVDDGDGGNIVRVNARRLRQKLSDYYLVTGAGDALRIQIDDGGYSPRFQAVDCQAISNVDPPRLNRRLSMVVGAVSVIVFVALSLTAWIMLPVQPDANPRRK